MGKILLTIIIFAVATSALARPWVGITSYYLLAILGPQYIWWWVFDGLRVSFIVAISTFLGVGFHVIQKNYDTKFLLNRMNFWLAVLWLSIVNSYFWGPYVGSFTSGDLTPFQLLSITNTIFVFYFFAALEMNKIQKVHYLVVIYVSSIIYLIYWANNQYFTQNWSQFNYGRLMGPISSSGNNNYGDENAFAMLFVTGIPFIYYLGWEVRRSWQRYVLWATIPLGWHAIFLTGSRGGLVGIGVTLTMMVLCSSRKIFMIPLMVFFFIFYQWQAGELTKQRSAEIVNYEGESSAEARLVAWKGGLKMIVHHPFSGVGLGSFATALPDYIESKPRVAHNTIIQFAAESGVLAGFAYLAVITIFFLNAKRISCWCRTQKKSNYVDRVERWNVANIVSFSGLIACSLFLSLNAYEIFFVSLIINNSLYGLCFK